jgi:hypothetical protein
MPRNAAGVYTLPVGNPVVTNTDIESAWANTTLADLATEVQSSLDRTGRGAMLAQFKAYDGILANPGISFGAELSSGFARLTALEIAGIIGGVQITKTKALGFDVTGVLTATSLATTASGGFGTTAAAGYRVDVNGSVRSFGGEISASGYGFRVLNSTANGGGHFTANAGANGGVVLSGDAGGVSIVGSSVVVGTFSGTGLALTVGVYSGDGSQITALNASVLASGTIPDARFPATLPALSGANLTGLNGSQVASGTVANARTTATSANTASAIVARDASGDFSMRGLTLGNADVAGATVLDWYLEGTWVPTLLFGGANVGMTTSEATGRYTRVGNRIDFNINITLTAKGASVGAATLTGLPVAASGTRQVANLRISSMPLAVDGALLAVVSNGATTLDLLIFVNAVGTSNPTALTDTSFNNASTITVSGTYFV